ncbi:MAG: alpha/beta hydrolase [Paracoccus sp. (in: a-proteobacteria)]|uniref:alpha/beta hydrolase n=1 Tax=Paracoccus sp. TaxID=267 RepID=UPI00324299FD
MIYQVHDWDDAYANGAHIAGAEGIADSWPHSAAAFRDRHPPLDLGRGQLFMPQDAPRGLMVFVHGGYWMRTDPSVWSHLAQGAIEAGWAALLPGYVLAPDARIAQMTTQVAEQIALAADRVAGPIAISGHSAGGHLAARMICDDGTLPAAVLARVTACVPISPLTDLRPLMRTQMNQTLRIDAAEAASESPALLTPAPGIPVTTWVGGSERPEFLRQARLLADIWAGLGAATDCVTAPGDHHFSVVEALRRPDSPLMVRLLGYSGSR